MIEYTSAMLFGSQPIYLNTYMCFNIFAKLNASGVAKGILSTDLATNVGQSKPTSFSLLIMSLQSNLQTSLLYDFNLIVVILQLSKSNLWLVTGSRLTGYIVNVMRSPVIKRLMARGSQVALKHAIYDMEARTLGMELRRRAIKRWVPCGDMDRRLKIPHSAKAECGFRTTPGECLYDSGPIGPSV